jgi:tetratricopeptide (TPR) repeat protein
MRVRRLLAACVALGLTFATYAHGVRVNKVELNLAKVTRENALAYASVASEDKVYLRPGDVFIVTPLERPETTASWYRVDRECPVEHYGYQYLRLGRGIDVVPLEGVIAVGKANVRELPSTDAVAVTTAEAGEVVTVLSRTEYRESIEGLGDDYWYEIETAAGAKGWIYGALVGVIHPAGAFARATRALGENDPEAALAVLRVTAERFPEARLYHSARASESPRFAFLPTAELLIGYAYFLRGETDEARAHYESALVYGDEPALTALKIIDPDGEGTSFTQCDYSAATLARFGLGLTYMRTDAAVAAEYLSQAIADSESGLSTPNIVPEYFDALVIRNLIALFEAGKAEGACLDEMTTAIPPKCKYDFAPAYFLLYYGEALERRGKSGAALPLYRRIVLEFPNSYLSYQGGYYTDYEFMDLAARAFWRIGKIKARLGETASLYDFCDEAANAAEDKRIGFLAHYLAGIIAASKGDGATASKSYARAERFYEAGDLGKRDYGYFYAELKNLLDRRVKGRPNTYAEEEYFKGLTSGA